MDEEERKCLPLLLNCFYYRETLFIVYELLRDNLYHMYARNDRTHTRAHPAPALAVRVNTRLNSRLAPYLPCQLQVRRRVPAAKVLHGARPTRPACNCRPSSLEAPPPPPVPGGCGTPLSPAHHPPRRSMRHGRSPSSRWSACRRSLGNASAHSSLCTRTKSSTAIWCATLRPEALLWVRPVHLPCRSPAHHCLVLPCRNRRTS